MKKILAEYDTAVANTTAFYDEVSKYYENFVPQETRDKRVQKLENFIRKKTRIKSRALSLLELGCGTGAYAILLAERGHYITGVDASENMMKFARKKQDDKHVSQAFFTPVCGDWIRAMQKLETKFDCVLCIGNSLIHNPSEILPYMFKNVYDLLAPGGVFLVNGRRQEIEWDMNNEQMKKNTKLVRYGGPANIQGIGDKVLRFMHINCSVDSACGENGEIVITFYTYDNYRSDRRRFVAHTLVMDNMSSTLLRYNQFSTDTYRILLQEHILRYLREVGFTEVEETRPFLDDESWEKNWYVSAIKPNDR